MKDKLAFVRMFGCLLNLDAFWFDICLKPVEDCIKRELFVV